MALKATPTLALAALLACGTAHAQTFEQRFQTPPDDARVMMRWWWFGPAVEKPELLREMQQMKAAGIGGFEIQPVYALALDDPNTGFHNSPYLSPAFLDDLHFVNEEAQKLGLRVSLTLSSGWPYGGPHTPVTEASAALHLVTTAVPAGERSVALPPIGNGEALQAVFLANGNWSTHAATVPTLLPLPAAGSTRMPVPAAADSSAQTVLWFVASRTGQQVKRAAVGADGFVLDHFSRAAVADHLRTVADPLMTAFAGHPPYSVFSDSLEAYGADWTPDLLTEFRNRRGYDLTPHLPELFSAAPDEQALSVRHDCGRTLTELIDANYLEPIESWATAHHTLFRSQTYGEPAVSLASEALADLPEGEGPQWRQFSYTRWATSAAHVYGRPVVSTETWTWSHSPAFRATPLDMKAEADRFFLQGSNQLMGHGWPYSPPSAGEPGWRFYAAGAFNAHNPWWPVMPDVTRYLQRVSWALRQGKPANDIAVYLPEDDAYAAFTPGNVALTLLLPRWITPELTQAIEDSGYNFDYIDSASIAARGIHYPVLLLPNVDRIPRATLEQIAQYRRGGGKVIALGRLPASAPGLQTAADTPAIQAMAHSLFAAGDPSAQLVPAVAQLAEALHRMQPPDMQLAAPHPSVGFIHRRLDDGDLYFIANTGNTPVHTQVSLRARRSGAEWLDADTGASSPARADLSRKDGPLQLDLAPYGSKLLLLRDSLPAPAPENRTAAQPVLVADLGRDWQVRFGPNGAEQPMPVLTSWIDLGTDSGADIPEHRFYSGTVTYRKSFHLPPSPAHTRILLDFGAGHALPEPPPGPDYLGMYASFDPPIREAAVVSINGVRVASLWHPPYRLDISAFVRPGENQLSIEVANTAINELAGEAQPDYRLLWARYGQRFVPQGMDHLAPLPSGLLGPVQLLREMP